MLVELILFTHHHQSVVVGGVITSMEGPVVDIEVLIFFIYIYKLLLNSAEQHPLSSK